MALAHQEVAATDREVEGVLRHVAVTRDVVDLLHVVHHPLRCTEAVEVILWTIEAVMLVVAEEEFLPVQSPLAWVAVWLPER